VDPGEAWSGRRRAKHRAPRRNRANARAIASIRRSEVGAEIGRDPSCPEPKSATDCCAIKNSLAHDASHHRTETCSHLQMPQMRHRRARCRALLSQVPRDTALRMSFLPQQPARRWQMRKVRRRFSQICRRSGRRQKSPSGRRSRAPRKPLRPAKRPALAAFQLRHVAGPLFFPETRSSIAHAEMQCAPANPKIPTVLTFALTVTPPRFSVGDQLKTLASYGLRQDENRGRFTRPTNAFFKKVDDSRSSVPIHLMHYNFCLVHQTLGVTPTSETGITN